MWPQINDFVAFIIPAAPELGQHTPIRAIGKIISQTFDTVSSNGFHIQLLNGPFGESDWWVPVETNFDSPSISEIMNVALEK